MAERVLGGRYALTALLGRGGMGEVWVARDQRIGREVAVKLLHGRAQGNGEIERFLREAQTAGRLNHPNVVTIHDVGQDDDGTLYIVMELLRGRDLAALVRAGRPAAWYCVDWAIQIASGLAAAHDVGIVHHDLKPSNAVLTDTGVVKIVDFGIARYASATTKASAVVGTVSYMAPERLQGKVGDARSDLYALGCMMFELLIGVPPFPGDNPGAIVMAHLSQPPPAAALERPDVPEGLRLLILELLAKDPGGRPATARLVLARLEAIRSSRFVPPTIQPIAQPLPPTWIATPTTPAVTGNAVAATAAAMAPAGQLVPRRSRKFALAIAAGVVLVGGGLGIAISLLPGPTSDSVTLSDLENVCYQDYANADNHELTSAECEQIAECYQPQLTGITLARFDAVAAYNSNSDLPMPPGADLNLVDDARKHCDSTLAESLSAFIDGVAGDT